MKNSNHTFETCHHCKVHWGIIRFTKLGEITKKGWAKFIDLGVDNCIIRNMSGDFFAPKSLFGEKMEKILAILKSEKNVSGEIVVISDRQFGMGVNIFDGYKESTKEELENSIKSLPLSGRFRVSRNGRTTTYPLTQMQLSRVVKF